MIHALKSADAVRSETSWLSRLDEPRFRRRLYAWTALAFYLLAVVVGFAKAEAKHVPFNFIVSDGAGYYVYLPAVVLDHTLKLEQQMRAYRGAGEFFNNLEQGPNANGYHRNEHPIGEALTIWPAFLLAHGVSHSLFQLTGSARVVPDGFSILYQMAGMAMIMALGLWTMLLTDRIIVDRLDMRGRWIALGVLVFWAGTAYSWYYFRDPFMIHVTSAFWLTATLYLAHRMLIELETRRWIWWQPALLAYCFTMALVCRPTDIVLLPLLIYLLWRIIRAGQIRRLLWQMPLVAVALLPGYLQIVTWKLTAPTPKPAAAQTVAAEAPDGGALGYQQQEVFSWTRPALLQTLFSSRHGLFFWSPALLLGAFGMARYLWRPPGRRDPLVVGLLVAGALLWYLNSCWYAWWFGEAFGARAFCDIAPLFIIAMALGFHYVAAMRLGVRRVIYGCVLLAVCYNYALMAAYTLSSDRSFRTDYLLAWF